jgi:beta-glucosidase
VNAEGLDFYDRLVDGMLARGLKPAATLYHWELPQPLADKGGWRNADMPNWFAEFTHTVMARIGDRVWSAAPDQRAVVRGWLSHFEGAHAPGLRDIRARAGDAPCPEIPWRAIEVMRGLGMTNLGAVVQPRMARPRQRQPRGHRRRRAPRRDLQPLLPRRAVSRRLSPRKGAGGIAPHLPKGWQDDFALIRAPLDWIGVNYYTRKRIRAPRAPGPAYAEAATVLPLTQMGWEIYPDGLRDFLVRLAREYSGDLPIYRDRERHGQCRRSPTGPTPRASPTSAAHLNAVREAIAEGAPVSGVFRLVADGQLRMGPRLREALRPRACGFRQLGKDPESVLSGARALVARAASWFKPPKAPKGPRCPSTAYRIPASSPISAAPTPAWRWPMGPRSTPTSVERFRNAEHAGIAR